VKKSSLTWMAAIGGACLVTAVITPRLAQSADHRDGPAVKTDPSTDINDVYTWNDGNNVVMAMTVFPVADANSKFSNAAAYVFHTESAAAFGATSNPLDIICTFDATQKISCWAGDEYVTGDASAAAGIASSSGKMKVFAGRRADPFFFNLEGFNDTRDLVVANAGGLTFNNTGCPNLDDGTRDAILARLQGTDGGTKDAGDFFQSLSTLAIVISIDKALVTKGGALMTVWASTNTKS
jgi:hypothetical protein